MVTPHSETLNEAQRLHYEAPKLTIQQKADLVGVSTVTYRMWLNGASISAANKKRLQELLDIRDYSKSRKKTALTLREREILRLVARGYSNEEIARQLSVQTPTVNAHVTHLHAKTRPTNRTEVAIY